ncbi:DUF2975 domain-containing protein [Aestuariispira insulae]|uniref:DUF2975 family protein n=1 Tax=Aestuariispira insulae TaxID=1461337 RepID=A0A3D9HWG4_9PROT|nr:DUF2975 domain-containing protein [Aestuariispira insulae]RED53842.1 hypothetical protein DFP90_101641 [Aestuariispira insulae]
MREQKIAQLVSILRWMVYLVVIVQIGTVATLFLSDDKIYFVMADGIWSQRISTLNAADQLFVSTVLVMPVAVFLWGVSQIALLCKLFEAGMIFSLDAVQSFKRFSIALVMVALAQTAVVPLLIVYLYNRDVLPAIPEPVPGQILSVLRADIFLVGVLFWLISKIVETVMEMKSEYELTV